MTRFAREESRRKERRGVATHVQTPGREECVDRHHIQEDSGGGQHVKDQAMAQQMEAATTPRASNSKHIYNQSKSTQHT